MCKSTATPASGDGRHVTLCGESLPYPGHVCAFFDSREQKYDTLIPFFAEGIEVGDQIINIVDAADLEDHVRTLQTAHVPVADAVDRGQMVVGTSEETYLKEGLQNLDGMLDLLEATLDEARSEQRGVRTCGEMHWVARTRMPIRNVIEYEARVNFLVERAECAMLCVYDVASIPSGLMSDILATHPFAIMKGRFRPNPHYVQPEDYLQMVNGRPD